MWMREALLSWQPTAASDTATRRIIHGKSGGSNRAWFLIHGHGALGMGWLYRTDYAPVLSLPPLPVLLPAGVAPTPVR